MAKQVTIDKKWIYIGIVVVAVIVIFLGIKAFSPKGGSETTYPTLTLSTTMPPLTTKLPGISIKGTKTDVVIINTLNERVYVNVTYRVFSQYYQDDYTESKVFEVWPNRQQEFEVYNNGGCANNECSVNIISFERVAHN